MASVTQSDDFSLTTEARALWVSRFDWGSPPLQRAKLEALIHRAADSGFNVILFQVRATGDAYYTPGLEPWSYRLTGMSSANLGRNPGWDPLAVAVEVSHARGMQLHAYINMYSTWECGRGVPPHTAPEHSFWSLADYWPDPPHYDPGWRVHTTVADGSMPMSEAPGEPVPCNEYVWASPGVERVNLHNIAVARDIAARYAVDGIHMDRVRYPGRQFSTDPETLTQLEACSPPVKRDDWQRDNLTRWIARLSGEVKAARPNTTVSAAVWFTYKKTPAMNFPTSQGFYDYYQDSHCWLETGAVDVIAPMIYGPTFDNDITKWRACADSHMGLSRGQVWLGIGATVAPFEGIAERIAYARRIGAAGVAVFSAGGIEDKGYWNAFREGPFRELAIIS
jgi:uncharacterized lipoprotein YddW (UPF0748 family)